MQLAPRDPQGLRDQQDLPDRLGRSVSPEPLAQSDQWALPGQRALLGRRALRGQRVLLGLWVLLGRRDQPVLPVRSA